MNLLLSRILFLIIILFALTINGQRSTSKNSKKIADGGSTQKLKCDTQSQNRLDTYLHKLLSAKFPTNTRELSQFCNQGYRSINYVKSFVRQCLPDFSQKIVSVVFFPIGKEISAICKKGRTSAKAKELMRAAQCGNAARPGLAKCYHNFVDSELAIIKAPDRKRMPMICCEFNKVRECFKTEAEEVKVCTARTIDFVERWALEIFGEIIDLMCYEYPAASDKCDKVLLEIPKLNLTGVAKPKSFLSPLVSIFADFGAEEAKDF